MNIFGEAAVRAAQAASRRKVSPITEWRNATESFSFSMRQKCCPKCAFLGLCEDGLVKGIPKGDYNASKANKKYAVDAVCLLRKNRELADNKRELWNEVAGNLTHNAQMDVVLSLWKEDLLR